MKIKVLIITFVLLLAGAVAGYYFGFDHGFEKAVSGDPGEPR
jgi:hypothetical protein